MFSNFEQHYEVFLINSLDIKTFYPLSEITLNIIELHIKELYSKKNQFLTISPVKFVNDFTKLVDLIISYILFR